MQFERFALEDWFADYKGRCELNITSSDVEPVSLAALMELMDPEVAEAWSGLSLGYGPSRGSALLRHEVADTYGSIQADQVHCFAGATEGLAGVVANVVSPGDHVVVVTPAYQLLTETPRACGASVTEVALRAEQGWRLNLDDVAAALTPQTRLVIANFPHNPTGSVLTRTDLDGLVDLTAQAGAYLLLDEIYRGLETEPLPNGADLGEHVISLSGVSKVYGVAGLRLGWIAARDPRLLDRLRTWRYYNSLSGSVTSDLLAVATLRARQPLLDRSRRIVADGTAALMNFLDEHREQVHLHIPRGDTTAYPQLLAHDAEEVAVELASRHSVFVAPSSVLLTAGQHLRLGLGRTALPAGLDRLADVLDLPS